MQVLPSDPGLLTPHRPQFEYSDLVVEVMALWLIWSGVAWLALAVHRYRNHGVDGVNIGLSLAALAGWAGLLRLTTGLLGGRELVPLDLARPLWSGLPSYAVLGSLGIVVVVMAQIARRASLAVAVTPFAFVAVSVFGIPLLVGDAPTVSLFSDPPPRTVSALPPATPMMFEDRPGMVYVPEGPFIMGTLNEAQLSPPLGNPGQGDEQPVRTVYLDAFFIDAFEVTNAQFFEFVANTGHVTGAETKGTGQVWSPAGWFGQPDADWRRPAGPDDSIEGLEDHPVVQVNWHDAVAFCEWVDKRLPTEAEWEKAARGIDARDYPWGHAFEPQNLNYCDAECSQLSQFNDRSSSDGFARTAPVGTFRNGVSPYGAFDMVGNVWEWVADWYDSDYYRYGVTENPPGPDRSAGLGAYEHKVVRGGSWTSERDYARATSRSFDPITWSYFGVGFRCAADR